MEWNLWKKTTLLNNGKIINHIGHFGRTQIQKCLLLLLRHILALNWVCLALSMVHFLWEKHCSSDFFLLLFLLYFMCGNCTTYRCIDNRIEWKCFSISFRCFPFSFFFLIFPSLFFLSHHITFLLFSFYPQIQSKHIYLFAKWLLALKWWQHWNRHTIRENFVFALSDVHFVQKA